MKVFQFDDHLKVIRSFIEANSKVRGYQLRLSKAAQIHPSYLSRVLREEVKLTPDQGANLCQFWSFNEDETEYFLALLNHSRAGSPHYRRLLQRKIQALREKHEKLSTQIQAKHMDVSKENTYYSAWYYSAIHTLLTIPGFDTPEAIAEKLHLSVPQTLSALKILEQLELVRCKGKTWDNLSRNIHLSAESWMTNIQHSNWRIKTTEQLQFRHPDALHFTGVYSMSREDFATLRRSIFEHVVESNRFAQKSKEEELVFFGVDFYKL